MEPSDVTLNSGPQQPGEARVAVLGLGVIGRVLATRLALGGVDVTLVARGSTREELERDGLAVRSRGVVERAQLPVVDVSDPGSADIVLVCVRANQLDGALDVVERMGSPLVVPMMHLGDELESLTERFGRDRVVAAFPGLGGYRAEDGIIEWLALGGVQPTTVDTARPAADRVVQLLRPSGLPVASTATMGDWMATHVVFVAAMGAAMVLADGDPGRLARDRRLLGEGVDGVRAGFRALRDRGVRVQPRAIAVLFLIMPRWFAIAYWQKALPGPMGRVTMAPHAWDSRDDEMPILARTALELTRNARSDDLRRLLSPFAEKSHR